MKTATAPLPPGCVGQGSGPVAEYYAVCITAYQPNRLMSTGFVPSSVSTVCVTRQPWAAAKSRAFLGPGWRTSARFRSPTHVRHWRPCCSSTARCCARICPVSGDRKTSAVAALAGGADPDEVVRILGFLEGEHRLFAQLCMERACGSVRVATAGQGSDFGSRHDHRAGGQGLQGSGLDVTRELAPSLREQLSRARACSG